MTPFTQRALESFDEKFPCKETNCDNNGTCIGHDREGDAEQMQCQYCFENRLPVKSFLLQQLEGLEREVREDERTRVKSEIDSAIFYLKSSTSGWKTTEEELHDAEERTKELKTLLHDLGLEEARLNERNK